jgi:Ala-tRNA(Pro) deacylase
VRSFNVLAFDELLTHLDHVYIEAGVHETSLKLEKAAFQELIADRRCFRFCSQVFH